jgi:hypothetical protein
MTTAGLSSAGVTCEHCEKPFRLLRAYPDMKSMKDLPDPFRARCPFCRQNATYPMSAIGTLATVAGDQH